MRKIPIILPSLFVAALTPTITLSSCSNSTFVVTLYADKGSFGESKSITLTGVPKNTKLKDIKGYVTPYLSGDDFRGWIDSENNYVNENDCINKNLLLKATYDSDFPVAVDNFETDPWATICHYANQGLGILCAAYRQPASWFVGKERTISVNQLNHKVLVVGTNNETYVKDGGLNFAALTFQFKNLLSRSDGLSLGVPWSSGGDNINYDYWNSALCHSLNGSDPEWHDPDIDKNAFEMIELDNAEWADSIKAVKQTHNVCKTLPTEPGEKIPWELETHEEKVFCPTISNYFSQKGIEETRWDPITRWDYQLYCAEGKQFQYYAQNIIFDSCIGEEGTTKLFHKLKLYNCGGGCDDYIVGTPVLSKLDAIWIVHDEEKDYGSFYQHWEAKNGGAVAPCFCI